MFADQQAAITAAGMLDSALGKGDTAPGFTLPADSGGAVALETALSQRPGRAGVLPRRLVTLLQSAVAGV